MLSDVAIAQALRPDHLHLIILPTEKCNFRCTYCYEDFVVGKMQPETVSSIKNLISNRVNDLTSLTISWFGGEPLLAKSVVLDLGSFAHNLCGEKNVRFSAGFTTNGYLLTPVLFQELLAISHKEYQITLDGDEEWHDKTRLLANRRPTFHKIWEHILAYKANKGVFGITLRLHVHRDNIESVKRLYGRLKKEVLEDNRFSIYFHKVSDLKPDHSISEGVLSRHDYLAAISYITGKDNHEHSGKAISEEHLDGYICYAAKPNSLMIRADGRLGKCTVALNDDVNTIGRINTDGTLDIQNAKLQKWFKGYVDLSENTLGCPLTSAVAT